MSDIVCAVCRGNSTAGCNVCRPQTVVIAPKYFGIDLAEGSDFTMISIQFDEYQRLQAKHAEVERLQAKLNRANELLDESTWFLATKRAGQDANGFAVEITNFLADKPND